MASIEHMQQMAKAALAKAYAPYSHFKVGVCLESASGQLFSGCNIENASYGLTLCAEGAAIAAMVQAGENCIQRIVIVSSGEDFCAPCGACRQRLLEFANNALMIYLFKPDGSMQQHSLAALLPYAFSNKDLK